MTRPPRWRRQLERLRSPRSVRAIATVAGTVLALYAAAYVLVLIWVFV